MSLQNIVTIFLICLALFIGGCASKLWPFAQETHYSIQGADTNKKLNSYLQEVLENRLEQNLEKTKDSEADMRREAYREQMLKADLLKAMHAKGYYDGQATYVDDPAKEMSGRYEIDAGAQYTLAAINVKPDTFSGFLDKKLVSEGQPIDAEKVLAAQKTMHDAIQDSHCYFNLDVKNALALDKKNHSGMLTYHVDAGAEGHFGSTAFTGADSVKISYLNKLIPWKPGDCYRTTEIEKLRTALLESGLFVGAKAVLPDTPLPDGAVPVEIELKERAQRTVRAGLSYYSDEGLGTVLGWEHRNFFGAAEKLTTELDASLIKQSLKADLTKPFFLRKDQDLSLNSALRHQDTDAFKEYGFDLGANISRKFNKNLLGKGGVAFTLTQIAEESDPSNDKKLYGLVSFPASLTFDNRNSKLDPSKGWLLSASLSPFVDALGESSPFFKSQLGASTYHAFDNKANYIIAFRANAGSILGNDTADIPPTERFYAGGGSVRGFGYQEVGPKDDNGEPLGGRSIATASAEFRVKFTDKMGGVAFIDAGSVSKEVYPDMKNIAIGTGLGARYYTDFGPLRFDIAIPLTQKENLDQNYQFYISIGQTF